MVSPEKFLLPDEDGLKLRISQEYARTKLKIIAAYLEIFCVSVRDKWQVRHYIDLEAGPGKNQIGNEILLESPLIALATPYGFTRYYFNEKKNKLVDALRQRVSASPRANLATISQGDVNKIVHQVCDEIDLIDSKSPSLNVALLDPEGLELEWTTVERLAMVRRMDLIINLSTSGIRRSAGAGLVKRINRVFGTTDWQTVYDSTSDSTLRRRALIDLYLGRLRAFGYVEFNQTDIPFKNKKGVQVYSLMFASKHKLGEKFWSEVTKRTGTQRLPGF